MRAILFAVAIVTLTLLPVPDAAATFNCFDTPQRERRCACIGGSNCIELEKSGSCKSDFECDDGELGAIICSCKAVGLSKTH
jgi:hypothetical protein